MSSKSTATSGTGTPTTSSFPLSPRSITSSLKTVLARLTPSHSSTDLTASGFRNAPLGKLFPQTNPAVDGEDCSHDCETCTIKYPKKWSIDESDELYGHINGWSRHLIVATGKTDWVRDVADEKGSIMEAVEHKSKVKHEGGKLMLSASNMPPPYELHRVPSGEICTRVLLLPAFTLIDNVRPSNVATLIRDHINTAPTNTTPLSSTHTLEDAVAGLTISDTTEATELIKTTSLPKPEPEEANAIPTTLPLQTRPCPHKYLILLCSQATRDARCGQSAPLLRREFERHLRPLGLYRDLEDDRPGGVGIYFISHVGGHKFSANVLIYRRESSSGVLTNGHHGKEDGKCDEAAQCIWLARVRPEDCENIVRYTVLQGKVVKPERQLRGGFDRGRLLVSW